MATEDTPKEDWMQKRWRPAMGWMYMLVCMMDMVIFPVLWSMLQAYLKQPVTQWNPLTLQGAGLFHLAMGAVLGIAAFGRTQEKIAGASAAPTTGSMSTPTLTPSPVTPPTLTPSPVPPPPPPRLTPTPPPPPPPPPRLNPDAEPVPRLAMDER